MKNKQDNESLRLEVEDDLKSRVMEDQKIIENLDGKKIIKTIVVPKKLVNLVVK
ncbi:MAG: hypothetical protein ACUZ8N_08760 [Candidatus Scalindua sp.]